MDEPNKNQAPELDIIASRSEAIADVDSFLRHRSARYFALYRNAPVMLHSMDQDGRIVSVNNYWLQSLGYKIDEVIGQKLSSFLTPDSRESVESKFIPEFFRKGFLKDAPYQFVSKEGRIMDVVLSAIAERDYQGRILRSLAVLTDVTELKRAERRIMEQNEFLKSILQSLTHPFYVVDARDYTVKMANAAACFGPLDAMSTCYRLTHHSETPCNGPDHVCPLRRIKETREPLTVVHVHYDCEGEPRHVEVNAYPVFDEKGEVSQVIEYPLDITDRVRMEKELRQTAEKIKLFAYSVSHDLKSPVSGINGLARLLYRQFYGHLGERGRRICEQILKASEQVLALVEEINIYIRTREMPLHFELIKPEEIHCTIRDEFEALLSVRQIQWEAPEGLPEIKADRLSLMRVFRNLVDNALKYGGPRLSRITIGYGDGPDAHIFSVSDDGVGIPREECEKVFALFHRNETARGVEGTGLGLAIVKEIAVKHQGRIWVESEPGRGATFYLAIPKDL